MAWSVPLMSMTWRRADVVTPCQTPISAASLLPLAWSSKHCRSDGVTCVSAFASPSQYKARWVEGRTSAHLSIWAAGLELIDSVLSRGFSASTYHFAKTASQVCSRFNLTGMCPRLYPTHGYPSPLPSDK